MQSDGTPSPIVNDMSMRLCVCTCASAQNVTEYHAAIDGASQRLMEKTERLSLADRDLVQNADDHAEELERQANALEE